MIMDKRLKRFQQTNSQQLLTQQQKDRSSEKGRKRCLERRDITKMWYTKGTPTRVDGSDWGCVCRHLYTGSGVSRPP